MLEAAAGCGLFAYEAETGALLNLDVTIGSPHAAGAINRALAWSGVSRAKRPPNSVAIDVPDLGLILSAHAAHRDGDPWSITAVIDRAKNYAWIPPYVKQVNSNRHRRRNVVSKIRALPASGTS